MATPVARQTNTYRDAKGQVSTASLWIKSAADANAQEALAVTMVADLNALSNAAFQAGRGPANFAPQGPLYGAVAVYETVVDKARLFFFTTVGSRHHIDVPAPKSAIFQPDGQTVDSLNALVATFFVDLAANCTTRDAETIQGPFVGVRIRRRIPRRATILVLAPDLIGPEE